MIYVIQPDVTRYLSFVLDGKEVRRKLGRDTMFHFDPSPKSYIDHWKTIEIDFAKLSGGPRGDMPDMIVRNGRLFLTGSAYQRLAETIKQDAEMLSVTYGEGESGYLCNVLTIAEELGALDEKLSTKNGFGELQSLSFHEDKLNGVALFRTFFDSCMGLYCSEAFKTLVETAGLKGVLFSADLGNVFPYDAAACEPTKH